MSIDVSGKISPIKNNEVSLSSMNQYHTGYVSHILYEIILLEQLYFMTYAYESQCKLICSLNCLKRLAISSLLSLYLNITVS